MYEERARLRALSLSTSSKSAMNLLSRSWIRNRISANRPVKLRFGVLTQAPYFRAWNEQDPDQRRRMLERSVTDDAVLVDPAGRWEGVPGLAERIGR